MKLKMLALATVAAATFAAPAYAATIVDMGGFSGNENKSDNGSVFGPNAEVFWKFQINAVSLVKSSSYTHTNLSRKIINGMLNLYSCDTNCTTNMGIPTPLGGALRTAMLPGPTGGTQAANLAPIKLAAGTYYVRLNGNLVTNAGNASSGSINYGFSINTVVPEPSTWMLMIMGFGLVASQLRRRYREGVAAAA